MANLESIQSADYAVKVQKESLPVFLDFGASWCSPCKRLAPILENLAAEWTGKAVIYSIDADTNNDLVMHFRVMSLPTVVLVKGGKEVHRLVGLQPKDKFVAEFGSHL
jgi:thioredoxin 1